MAAVPAQAAPPAVLVSIVMPVRNERAQIEATLDAVFAQDLDEPFEVIVADGASTDGTREYLETRALTDSRLRVVDNPRQGTPQALNLLLAAARGRYLVRIDGHSSPPKDYVRNLLHHLRAGECEAVGGAKHAVGTTPFGRATAKAHNSRLGIGDSKYHYATDAQLVHHVPFGAYVTERVRGLGGWDEHLVRNQDAEFDYRYRAAGGRILLDPSIVIDWHVRESLTGLVRQQFEYGFWRFRSFAMHPASFRPRWLVPPLLVLALALGIVLSWSHLGAILLGATAAAYAAFLAAAAATLGRHESAGVVLRLPAALATMQLSWGAGFLVSSVLRVFAPRWSPGRVAPVEAGAP
jgi:glycosyltransferase involved in cell wall biosynthesis